MPAANPNWVRWVFASVATYLKEVAKQANIPVLVEGLDERTDALMKATDRCEVRISGPFSRELSHNYFRLEVDVNVLFYTRLEESKNRYGILKIIGDFQEAMDSNIPVCKCGDEPGDDETASIGCLAPRNGRNDSIRVLHFGQIDPTDRLKQSMVDARYVMELQDS